jgi:hypothetical protein
MDFKLKTQVVKFVDSAGKVIGEVGVTAAGFLEDQRLGDLENDAIARNLAELAQHNGNPFTKDEERARSFRVGFYPKMAACSTGDIPSEDEALHMPSAELDKWWTAAKECNPRWFEVFKDIEKMSESELKKKGKKPAGSSPKSGS